MRDYNFQWAQMGTMENIRKYIQQCRICINLHKELHRFMCVLGVWTCILDVWTCILGVWTRILNVWTCILGVRTCILGVWADRRMDGPTERGDGPTGPDGWTCGQTDERTDSQTDGRTVGRMDGRMDGWTDRRKDGRLDRRTATPATLMLLMVGILLVPTSTLVSHAPGKQTDIDRHDTHICIYIYIYIYIYTYISMCIQTVHGDGPKMRTHVRAPDTPPNRTPLRPTSQHQVLGQ